MTTPAEIFDGAAATIFQTAADPGPATFIPATGDPVSCSVDIRHAVEYSTSGMNSQYVERGTTLEYLLSETGQVARIGDTFLVGATTWTVEYILYNDGRFAKVVVK